MNKHNYIWFGILFLSLVGGIFLFKIAYANPLNLPSYSFKNPQVKEAYQYALLEGEKLEGLPCNCGCMDPEGASSHSGRVHSRGLVDCFMKGDVNNGGEWDSHASECGLCYEDALNAKRLYSEGKTKEEIREFLNEKFKNQIIGKDTVY